jgi:hypothetical protein
VMTAKRDAHVRPLDRCAIVGESSRRRPQRKPRAAGRKHRRKFSGERFASFLPLASVPCR